MNFESQATHFHSHKMHLKVSSVKWRPFCSGEDEFTYPASWDSPLVALILTTMILACVQAMNKVYHNQAYFNGSANFIENHDVFF